MVHRKEHREYNENPNILNGFVPYPLRLGVLARERLVPLTFPLIQADGLRVITCWLDYDYEHEHEWGALRFD